MPKLLPEAVPTLPATISMPRKPVPFPVEGKLWWTRTSPSLLVKDAVGLNPPSHILYRKSFPAKISIFLDGRIAPRSGLASKNFIDTGAGVIDADYRGQVKVLLFNHAETDFEVKEGDRVAQLIIERIYTPEIQVVEELEESVRGAGGFGSTG